MTVAQAIAIIEQARDLTATLDFGPEEGHEAVRTVLAWAGRKSGPLTPWGTPWSPAAAERISEVVAFAEEVWACRR